MVLLGSMGAPARVLLLGAPRHRVAIGVPGDPPVSLRHRRRVLHGPGCFDMKTGLALALHATAVLGAPAGVTILVTGDEEIGSPSSRALIEAEASRHCVAALVLEASADGGAFKTERKGTSVYQIRVLGRAAHSGLEPEKGVNATY